MGSVGSGTQTSAIDLYRQFTEGGSMEIHALPEAKKKVLDTVFTPAPKDMTVYKGMAIPETELNNIQSSIQSYSSTTEDKVVAEDYANKAYDIGENFARVIATVKIEKGTPIADTRQLLGNTGMHAYEKEITVGRKADYTFGKLVKHTDRYGDDYYTVNVKVRRK